MNCRVLLAPVAAAACAAAILLRAASAHACAIETTFVFTPGDASTVAYEKLIGGELGILQPGYGIRYLFPAYRTLTGRPLSAGERKALLEVGSAASSDGSLPATNAYDEWLTARAEIAGAGTPPEAGWYTRGMGIYRSDEDTGHWRFFLNCSEDAFRTAARTLRERVALLGKDSPDLPAWVRAQDTVFSNCGKGRAIPEPAPEGASSGFRADRAYQVAAAHFYAEDYDEAERLFRAIAADPSSPWRDISAYLVGRTLLRKATVLEFSRTPASQERLSLAAEHFTALLADPSRAAVHGPAAAHLDLAQGLLDPAARVRGLAEKISSPGEGAELTARLDELRYLLVRTNAVIRPLDGDLGDFTAWVLTLRALRTPRFSPDTEPPGRAHTLQRALEAWERTRSDHWIIAALMAVRAGDPQAEALLEAAARVPDDSPAHPTAAYHRLRLLIASGKLDEGRTLADTLLADPRRPPAERNLILAERFRAARSIEELLHDAQRVPIGITYDGVPAFIPRNSELAPLFDGRALLDRDAASVLNEGLPLARLAQAAAGTLLPPHVRRQVATAVFVRALLLGDHVAARAIAPTLRELVPELGEDLAHYLAARGDEAGFAAALMMLRAPGMEPTVPAASGRITPIDQIDRRRHNWWPDLGQALSSRAGAVPFFLTTDEKAALGREREILRGNPCGPKYLGEIVLSWARAHRRDPRIPEALHRVVVSIRFGPINRRSEVSREAFELLHRRYPQSEWTQKTPYWF